MIQAYQIISKPPKDDPEVPNRVGVPGNEHVVVSALGVERGRESLGHEDDVGESVVRGVGQESGVHQLAECGAAVVIPDPRRVPAYLVTPHGAVGYPRYPGWISRRCVMGVGATKTAIEIDDEALAAAAQVLGTRTKKETVNAALREVSDRFRRLRALDELGAMADRGDFAEFVEGGTGS